MSPFKFDVRIGELCDIQRLSEEWRALEKDSNVAFFLSWYWIGSWLTLCPPCTKLLKLCVYDAERLVGLAIFSERNDIKYKIIRSKVLQLHDYGLPGFNMVIEYNGILTARGYENIIPREIIKYLVCEVNDWDEIRVNGIHEDNQLIDDSLIKEFNLEINIEAESYSKYVDLHEIGLKGGDFLATLSRNTRYQIRRSIKKYVTQGPLKVSVAKGVSEALKYFNDLEYYHQIYWNQKGQPGSFSNKNWVNFHCEIISKAIDSGGVQLMRISAGDEIIGYLYNLIREGNVYMIQSGLNYTNDPVLHPGYVSHYMAIEYNMNEGNNNYDFLAGKSRYKTSLSNQGKKLVWVRIQKRRLIFVIEEMLKNIKRTIMRDNNIEF